MVVVVTRTVDTLLAEEASCKIVLDTVGTARYAQVVIRHRRRLADGGVVPVGNADAVTEVLQLFGRVRGRNAHILLGLVVQAGVFITIIEAGITGYLLYAVIAIIVNGGLAFLATLGLDQDDTVGTLETIYGCRSILQDTDRLDVVGIYL